MIFIFRETISTQKNDVSYVSPFYKILFEFAYEYFIYLFSFIT